MSNPITAWMRYSPILLGPALIIGFITAVAWRANHLTNSADATVGAVERYQTGSGSVRYCPVFSWTLRGETVRATSEYCTAEDGVYSAGSEVPVRFMRVAAGAPIVRPDGFWPMYGEALPMLGGGLFFSLLGLWQWRRRHEA